MPVSKNLVRPNYVDREDVSFHLGEVVDELTKKYRLSRTQRQFLFVRIRFPTDTEAARACGLSPITIKNWKKPPNEHNLGDFGPAYQEFFRRFEVSVEEDMKSLLGKAKRRTEELLDATKTVQSEDGPVTTPDYEARFKGIQALYHWLGRWGRQPSVEVNPVHLSISEEFAKRLQAKADREQRLLEDSRVIEGEVVNGSGD